MRNDDYLDPDTHLWGPEEDKQAPAEHQLVLDWFAAETEAQCRRRLYKATDCGAWVEFGEDGITLGSIVEGCDFGTNVYLLRWGNGFKAEDIQARIDEIEREAEALWKWCNEPMDAEDPEGQTAMDAGCDAPDGFGQDFEVVGRSA